MKQTVKMVQKDVKQHSVRYDAAFDAVDPIVTNIYAMKVALPRDGKYPAILRVTVEWEDVT